MAERRHEELRELGADRALESLPGPFVIRVQACEMSGQEIEPDLSPCDACCELHPVFLSAFRASRRDP